MKHRFVIQNMTYKLITIIFIITVIIDINSIKMVLAQFTIFIAKDNQI